MTKIKLVDGTIINAESVELSKGILKITITDGTVEELAALFDDKSNTSLITLMTESGVESGYKKGFTSFAGIMYGADGTKTVELYQPTDATEARISNAEGAANAANTTAANATSIANEANAKTAELEAKNAELEAQNIELATTMDSILTDVIPSLMA